MSIIKHNPVLRETAHILVPFILLYALYVQFHGDFGPGGGFQAGVIFSVGIIIYILIHGLECFYGVISLRAAELLSCIGVLLYAGTGVATMLLGGSFLEYSQLSENPIAGQHLGIFLIEAGVGITIVGVVITVFYLFTGERRSK